MDKWNTIKFFTLPLTKLEDEKLSETYRALWQIKYAVRDLGLEYLETDPKKMR